MTTVPLKVMFFVSETAGLPQCGAKKRTPVKLGCMPVNDAAEQWMLIGGEWKREGGGGIKRLGHGKTLAEEGHSPFPPPLFGHVGRPSDGPTFKSKPRSGPASSCTPGNKYGGGGADHAEHLHESSRSTSADTVGVVSQSVRSGSDDFGSDVSLSKNSNEVHNSCRPVFPVCLGLRSGFSLV